MVKTGQKFSFGVTYDTSNLLYVAAKIFDVTGSSPVLLSTVPMPNIYGYTYYASFVQGTPASLLIQYSVYTDGTYTSFDNNYAQGDVEHQVVDVPGQSFENVIGYVNDPQNIIGYVNC